MHFVISQTQLSQALSEVKSAIATRPTHPILANVRLDADAKSQTIMVTAFDLNLAIQLVLPAQIVIDGSITVPHKLTNEIVSRLPDEDITFMLNDAGVIDMRCGSGRYQLYGLPTDEFPELPKLDTENSDNTELSSSLLLKGLAATLFASSGDETKRILTGIHLTVLGDSIEFAATDGHRLTVLNQELPEGDRAKFSRTIPARSLRELEKHCKAHESNIAIAYDNANIIFATSTKTVISRLLDGAYPNYRQLIPAAFERRVTFERRLFLAALERIAVLADQKNNIVKLTVDSVGQAIALSVESPDVAAGREEVPTQVSGEDIEIAFNTKYLLEGLKSFDCSELQLQLNSATSPAVIVPIGADKRTYLLMPVQIRN